MSKRRRQNAGGMFDRPAALLSVAAIMVMLAWVSFTASPRFHELMVGAFATALTTLFFANVLRTETLALEPRLRDFAQCWRIPWYVLSGCWEITWLLVKDLAGKRAGSFYRACGFRTSARDPLLASRSALAVGFTSTAPNFIVIDIDPEQSLMLFHQIERSTVPKMTQALGAHQ